MITLTVSATKYPVEIENTVDGKAVNVEGKGFLQYARYQENQPIIPNGEYASVTFLASRFKDSYSIREIVSAKPLQANAPETTKKNTSK